MDSTNLRLAEHADMLRKDMAYVTLVTKDSYLTGAIILAYSLQKCSSVHPLIILVTPSLGEEATMMLELEATFNPIIIVKHIDALSPPEVNTGSAAARFADTFTKLRAFQLYESGYKKCVFLDADMAVFQNPDELFDVKLPDNSWIAANHACVCNLDNDDFAPPEWKKGNCAYTPLEGPDAPPTRVTPMSRPTYHLLNSGMFVYEPTQDLWDSMMHEFNVSDKVKGYKFPDQDFMADFFYNRWQSLSWKFNALKTMRYWHPRMYKDDHVVVLHYIVDKPWQKRIAGDNVAGHLGRDGHTHKQWWDIFDNWKLARYAVDQTESRSVVGFVNDLVPPPLTTVSDAHQVDANKQYDGDDGSKIAVKPLGSPVGELSDVVPFASEQTQSHPYDHHFPHSPSEISETFDECAQLALAKLLTNSSSATSLTSADEGASKLLAEADPEQCREASLLYWYHEAQVLRGRAQDLEHSKLVLETENRQLHAELDPIKKNKRPKLPSMAPRFTQADFSIGPSSSETSPRLPAVQNMSPESDSSMDSAALPPPSRPVSSRQRLLISATHKFETAEEESNWKKDREKWAAAPDEADALTPEERVANVLGHTKGPYTLPFEISPPSEVNDDSPPASLKVSRPENVGPTALTVSRSAVVDPAAPKPSRASPHVRWFDGPVEAINTKSEVQDNAIVTPPQGPSTTATGTVTPLFSFSPDSKKELEQKRLTKMMTATSLSADTQEKEEGPSTLVDTLFRSASNAALSTLSSASAILQNMPTADAVDLDADADEAADDEEEDVGALGRSKYLMKCGGEKTVRVVCDGPGKAEGDEGECEGNGKEKGKSEGKEEGDKVLGKI